MQVLIDIPDKQYNYIKKQVEVGIDNPLKVAIAKGIPLPKGHGDLIDVSRKITVSTYDEQYEEWGEKSMTVLDALNKWSDEGVRVEDVIIPADNEFEEREE